MPHPSITAQAFPKRPAIIMGGSGRVVTYQQLDERSNQGAHLFRSVGLNSGDHICILMENNPRFLEIVWAAQRSGLVFTPISPHLGKDDIVHILGNCKARLLVTSGEFAGLAETLLYEPNHVDQFYMVNGTQDGYTSWEEATAPQPVTPIADEGCGVPMFYSSGITGTPKGILIEPFSTDIKSPPMVAPYLAPVFGFDTQTTYLSTAPLYHSAPLHYSMMATFQGGTTVVMERFDAEQALKLIERHRVTHSLWVPIMFIRMLRLPAALRKSYDVTSMKVAIHGAAPCPVDIKEEMIDWWGEILFEYYSSSEGVGMTLIDTADWLVRKGSVGKALVGQIHIVGQNGTELPPGEKGMVYFSGDHIRFSYYKDPQTTTELYHEKGWATVQDIGYIDDDGFLFLTERKSFTIFSGGIKIYPHVLENILARHDKVADVAVFGVPSEIFDEEVKVVIEPASWSDANDKTAAEILHWLSSRVSGQKMPRSVHFHPKLPRLGNGKLCRQQLAEEYRIRGREMASALPYYGEPL